MGKRGFGSGTQLIGAVCCAMILIVGAMLYFQQQVDKDIQRDMQQQVEAIRNMCVEELVNEFSYMERLNESAARFITELYQMGNQDIEAMLRECLPDEGMRQFFCLTAAGPVYASRGEASSALAAEIAQILADPVETSTMLQPWYSPSLREVLFGLASPMELEGEKALLVVTYPVSRFREMLTNDLLGGSAEIGLVGSDGVTILGRELRNDLGEFGLNIFDALTTYHVKFSAGSVAQMRADMAAGKASFSAYYVAGTERYCSYAPVADSDWYVMVLAQEVILREQSTQMSRHGMLLTTQLVLIMTALLVAIVFFRHREQRHIQLELEKAATLDGLTGILNRGTAENEIIATLQNPSATGLHALLLIDIDDFKRINDDYGHVAGDTALRVLVRRMEKCFYPTDIIGRMGGDEFIVLMKDCASQTILRERVEQLVVPLSYCHPLTRETIAFSISVGISVYGSGGANFLDLYQHADEALYQTKDKGKSGYSFYTAPEPD